MNEGLMASKRSSTPRRLIRRNRKVPSRSAQIDTRTRQEDRSRIEAPGQQQGADRRAQVGQAAREVVVVLGLRQVGGQKHDPLDEKCERPCQREQGQPRNGDAALTAGPGDSGGDHERACDRDQRFCDLILHVRAPI